MLREHVLDGEVGGVGGSIGKGGGLGGRGGSIADAIEISNMEMRLIQICRYWPLSVTLRREASIKLYKSLSDAPPDAQTCFTFRVEVREDASDCAD